MPPEKHSFVVAAADAGKRLDQILAANVPGLSRRKARVLIDIGGVFVDRSRVKVAGRKLRAGQRVDAVIGGAFERATKAVGKAARRRDASAVPEFEVVLEDEQVVVVNKPSGLLTAPTPESDRNNLADALSRRGSEQLPLWVVHRLDMETSGLLVFARTPRANKVLSDALKKHDVQREYLAVLRGVVEPERFTVDEPVGGKRAVTHFQVLRRFAAATEVQAQLETGRTHQIRLHALSVEHPVLGDPRYGEPAEPRPPRMALHATRLSFAHPATGETVELHRPWPSEMQAWLDTLDA